MLFLCNFTKYFIELMGGRWKLPIQRAISQRINLQALSLWDVIGLIVSA